jgi:cytochrome b pre-mRNA-processing protein 3
MLGFLFRTLTAEPHRGAALFDAVTAKAREPHWYVEGTVPDTLDGRFAVLATVAALVLVRLEQAGESGNAASVALTERFIEVMESEHRELGIGDPTLGKTVRKLVGSLSRRTELWRLAATGERDWNEATRESLYKEGASAAALRHSAEALKRIWTQLQSESLEALEEGKFQ